jgi:hypothetical protein
VIRRWKPELKSLAAAAVLSAFCGIPSVTPTEASQRRAVRTAAAQQPGEKKNVETTELPIIVINAASADRLLNDVQDVFKAAGKPEIYTALKGFLGNYGDLKGIDRGKPFGLMLFLETGIPPSVVPVGYVPVARLADLLRTIGTGPFTTKKIAGKTDSYEIIGTVSSLYMSVRNGYAFISNKEDALDRTFPEPVKMTRSLAARYDIAAAVNMNAVSKQTRQLFATVLRTSAEAEIQQRDDEPAAVYEARRARSMRDLEWIEAFLLDCEKVLIGLDASAKNRRIVVEISVEAREKSKMAKMLKHIGGKRSYFDSLLNEKAPLSVSLSWGLSKLDTEAAIKSVRFLAAAAANSLEPPTAKPADKEKKPAKEDAKAKVAEEKKKADELRQRRRRGGFRFQFGGPGGRRDWPKNMTYPENTPIARVAETLIATAENGHADFFFQFVGKPPEKFSIIAGAQVQDGRKLAAALKEVLEQVKKRDGAPPVELDATRHRGISFHRISFTKIPPQMALFFGDKPSVLVGASSKALWACIGTEAAFDELKKAIDVVFDKKSVGTAKKVAAPFRIAVNVAPWLAMGGKGNADGRPTPGLDAARKAFEKGGDGIRVEVQTTENALRLRAQLDEGFIRFLGLRIAHEYERRQRQ